MVTDILQRIEALQAVKAEADVIAADAGRAVHAAQLELVYQVAPRIDAAVKARYPEASAVVVPTEWTAADEFYFPHWIEIRGCPPNLSEGQVWDLVESLLPEFSSEHYSLRPGEDE